MQLNRNNLSGAEEFSNTKRLNEIKSQKNLISENYIEENTEEINDGHNEEGRRPTEMENIEMRQTYGRPKMLKKSKLPWNKARPVVKEHREDSLKFMISNNQYNQARGLLPPLPMEEKEKKQNFSPYNMIAKFDNFRNQFNNILERDKSDLLQEGKKSYKAIMASKYRTQEFLNLEIIKSIHHTGVIKKVIHLPTFKLYAAKEEYINNKETLYSLKEWVLFWQSKANQDEDSPFIKIINIDWNNPEGYITIITEYMVDGSLENLLESVGTLPENAIQELCYPILKSLHKFYSMYLGGYGSLSPSQILFGPNLTIKMGLGLGCRSAAANNTIYNLRPVAPKINIFNVDEQNLWAKSNSKNNELERSFDILKFGLILLRASVGNFEMFCQSTSIFESVKELLTEQGQKLVQSKDLCCIIHSEKEILDLQLHERHDKQEGDDYLSFQFQSILKDRYSSVFIHMLCMCLQLSHKKRCSLQDVINYSFVKSKTNHSAVKVTLQDLHKITKPSIDLQGSKYDKKLDLIIKSVQSNIRQGKFQLLPDFKSINKAKIIQLAEDLEIPEQMLENKINEWKKYNSQY